MIKIVFLSLFFLSLLNSNTDKIDKKISQAKKEIEAKKEAIKNANITMEELGKNIAAEEKKLEELSRKLQVLSESIDVNRGKLSENEKIYKELNERKKTVITKKQALERELVDIIAKNLAYSEIISLENKIASEKDVVLQEIFKSLNKIVQEQSKNLKDDYIKFASEAGVLEKDLNRLKGEIEILKSSRDDIAKLKKQEQEYISKLNTEKTIYKSKIKKLMDEQESGRALLANLNITKIKIEEEEKIKIEKEKAEQGSLAETRINKIQPLEEAEEIKIRHIGSSYQGTRKVSYKGQKVDAPIDGFEVVKKFGPYMDPVYNIKIHNDSVTLKSSKKDAVVRSVMDGKVIFAKDFNMLGNTVIIKHDDNVHTIYSNLSKIAPDIIPGKSIRKKSAIGRVDEELKFEVTKDEMPIDPFELIRG
ncbi:MAG: hypothetical protein QG567_346 [Campylobacterota bacterium]|nr:hypothetical protein [Campylobacterota bacterium]